jgi:hypothetical protein
MNPTDYITILDNSGAIYFGVLENESATSFSIKNPATIICGLDEKSGKLEINVYPVFLRELLSEKSKKDGISMVYSKDNIKFHSHGDFEINEQILEHYNNVFEVTA